MIKKFAVIGNPIAQSKSPKIHQMFALQCGHSIEYTKISATAENFVATVAEFKDSGGLGMNVTAPFKMAAAQYANSLSERAKLAFAVNTLVFKPNRTYGDNTDGIGLVNDIESNLEQQIATRKVLIIGAGGAARGVLFPILQARPQSILIINRTAQKAADLANLMPKNSIIHTGGFDASRDGNFDIVINATSTGLSNAQLPEINYNFKADSLAYDLVYGDQQTAFMRAAKAAGASRVSDGLGMLVEQAAFSYKLWHGVMPDTKAALQQLR